jgi:cytochrome oxidase Cu insertion factor (SCO1/SenC/PrrC family)
VIAKVRFVRAMLAVLSLALAAPDVGAQGQANPAPEDRAGLKVGEKAPRFTLKDQQGRERSLDSCSRRARSLVFYRSADW